MSIDWSNKDAIRIARRHHCPVCGRIHYIGRDEERNAWECITDTAQHLYIAQCRWCGGLIEIHARGDEPPKKTYKAEDFK